MTPEESKAVKAGKRERIRELLETLRTWEPKPLVDEELLMLLAVNGEEEEGW